MGLAEVDVLITLGRIEVRRAVDVFGESAFPSFGIFSLFDTVTGGTMSIDPRAHGRSGSGPIW